MADVADAVLTALVDRGVARVWTYPAAAIDHAVRLLDAQPDLDVIVGLSEMHAAWAGLAMAEASGARTAVVLPAAFSLPGLGPIVAAAIERHAPLDLLCLGTDPLDTPLPAWWPVVGSADYAAAPGSAHDGPVVVVERDLGARPGPTPAARSGAATTVDPSEVSAEWLAQRRAEGRAVVVALPPVLHPWRGRLEQVALDRGLPVVTVGGADPFACEHPELWLGRTGFVPSPAVVDLLATPDGAALIAAPCTRLPSWIGSRTAPTTTTPTGTTPTTTTPTGATPTTTTPTGATPTTTTPTRTAPTADVSPAFTAITELAARHPAAWFVADAGSAHRYVAGLVANAGRPTLLTDGLTHMGWSLPTTLGASLAAPERTWVTVLGDGAALMGGTELAALARHGVPAVVVLLDNGTLGARYAEPVSLRERARLPEVDWVAFGESLGVEGARWRPGDEGLPAAVELARAERRPFLLVVSTPPSHPDVQRFPIVVDDVDCLLADVGAH